MAGKKKKPSGYVKAQTQKEFEGYVEHPRFGRYPRFTGENAHNDWEGRVFLHWRSRPETRVPDTAVAADLSRQTPATVPVTHYYDEKRSCLDCHKPFLFFALEQKHWYEELGFTVDSDCVRCPLCRKKTQWLARKKERYDELFHAKDKTADETLEMADCCLTLIEEGIFTAKQEKQVRTLLNSAKMEHSQRHAQLLERLKALKAAEE